MKLPAIKIPKISRPSATANLASAISKHILFSRKSSKVQSLPKSIIKSLPAVLRG